LEVLAGAERRRVLVEWNDTAVGFSEDACVHELFEAQVARAPDATALVCGGEELSYRELNGRANRLARRLVGLGVGPEVPVGICVDRSVDQFVAVLGVWKAGGAAVPLDALMCPPERLAFMVGDAGVAVLVAHGHLADGLPTEGVGVVCLDREAEDLAAGADGDLGRRAGARNLAYVEYTSGSTGEPKGVMVEHRGLVNVAEVAPQVFEVGPRVLQFAPFSFDICFADLVLALTRGSALVVAPVEAMVSGEVLGRLLVDQQVSNIQVSPSVLAQVPVAEYPALRVVCVGAEVCPAELVDRWAVGGRRFLNVYGPTEATICATYARCEPGVGRPPIGRPMPNVRVFVLDRAGRAVPVGVTGEIYLAGAGLARGYLNRPELTAEVFVELPVAPGERLYRTGDVGRWLPDGQLEFLGRADDQVKIRGYRVELGEIEAVLGGCDAVGEVAVVAREDTPGDRRLVAYVVCAGGAAPSVSELRGVVGERLPAYMIPAAFVFLDELPLTPHGKIDRAALPAPGGGRPDLAGEYVAPRDGTEALLAQIWAELLGLDRVGAHDNFFELGGDSLLSVRVMTAVSDRAGVNVELSAIFEAPTVALLAVRVADAQAEQARIVDLIDRVSDLPLDEVRRLLAAEEVTVDELGTASP
jgi:amino acid adenylation domain-containing protein